MACARPQWLCCGSTNTELGAVATSPGLNFENSCRNVACSIRSLPLPVLYLRPTPRPLTTLHLQIEFENNNFDWPSRKRETEILVETTCNREAQTNLRQKARIIDISVAATGDVSVSIDLILLRFVLIRVFRGSFLGCIRTIHETHQSHDTHEITRSVL